MFLVCLCVLCSYTGFGGFLKAINSVTPACDFHNEGCLSSQQPVACLTTHSHAYILEGMFSF